MSDLRLLRALFPARQTINLFYGDVYGFTGRFAGKNPRKWGETDIYDIVYEIAGSFWGNVKSDSPIWGSTFGHNPMSVWTTLKE